jgi:adenosylcobinamide kinase/adenosylcobinamide-phosphate guanylyltransferase
LKPLQYEQPADSVQADSCDPSITKAGEARLVSRSIFPREPYHDEKAESMGETILVLGGSRSGKSDLAARLAAEKPPVSFVATAIIDPNDEEMVERVRRHRVDRPDDWKTIEGSVDLEPIIRNETGRFGSILIDCVTLWLGNLMLGIEDQNPRTDGEIVALVDRAIAAASESSERVVWVSNEVGWGVVPENRLARRFADLQGTVNRRIAAASDRVILCVAGLSIDLKP